MTNKRTRKPVHPGEVFFYDVLEPLKLTVTDAAKMLNMSRKHLSNLCNGKVRLSPEIAAKFAASTETTIKSWLTMQTTLDIWELEQGIQPNVEHFPKQVA